MTVVYPSRYEEDASLDRPAFREDPTHLTDFTRRQIASFLASAKKMISENRAIVKEGDPSDSDNTRLKNINFMNVYGLYIKERRNSLLMSIQVEDFCHALKAPDGSLLYVFSPEWELYKAMDGMKRVRVYLKEQLENKKSGEHLLVVSLHELEWPIDRIFD